MMHANTNPFRRRGIAYVIALCMLALMAVLAAAFINQTSLGMVSSDNYSASTGARMAAEGGMGWIIQRIGQVRVPENADVNQLALSLRDSLASRLNGTANLHGSAVQASGATVTVPPITVGGSTFQCVFTFTSTTTCQLVVSGMVGQATRRVALNLDMTVKRSGAFDFGLASRGPITVGGSAQLVGVNNPGEANVLSVTTSAATAISVSGHTKVTGDLSVSGGSSAIAIAGSPTVGNTSNSSQWGSHCHFNVEPPDFPAYETASLASLCTSAVDSTTNFGVKTTLSNVRIKAGTNPTFNNHMTLNGIIYVEAPNKISFEGQATINGFIVTQEAQPSQLSQCQISFAGGVDAYGVETLPNTSDYAAVKAKKGSFIVAPGFGVSFAGNVNAVNGNIAASQLTFTGTATGTVRGSVIGLADLPTSLGGTVNIYVDRTNAEQNPVGFTKTYALTPNPDSYLELSGQ